jgi:hypothetical protein
MNCVRARPQSSQKSKHYRAVIMQLMRLLPARHAVIFCAVSQHFLRRLHCHQANQAALIRARRCGWHRLECRSVILMNTTFLLMAQYGGMAIILGRAA